MERFIKSTAGRRWLYGVAIAAVALAAAYGLITEELGALWVAVIAALLGLPVAAGNVTNGGVEPPAPVEPIPGTTLDLDPDEQLPYQP